MTPVIIAIGISCAITFFMLGAVFGMRSADKDYVPLIESLLKTGNLLAKDLELTRASLNATKGDKG